MKFLSSLTKKDLANKICLLRVDLNIQDVDLFKKNIHPRILAVLPTIEFLIGNGAKVVILGHRGRPEINKKLKIKNKKYQQFSLKPFAKILSYLLKKPVNFIDFNFLSLRGGRLRRPTKQSDPKGCCELRRGVAISEIASLLARNDTEGQFRNSTSGNIFLLENLRFFTGEKKNDKKFAEKLASLGDIYINDAFAVSHRKNASVAAITKFLPSYAGLLLEKEIKNLDETIKNPKRPLVVIFGGAKISDKIGLIKSFLKKVKGQKSKVNYILIGGGMANTFLAGRGLPIGDSLYDKNADAAGLLRKYSRKPRSRASPVQRASLFYGASSLRGKIILPIDVIVHKKQILDIGPKTVEKYSKIIENAGTIIWNGPMGYIEDKKFRKGSEAIAKAIIKSKAFSIIGGGETVNLLKTKSYKLKANIFISTGGGAMLEYLAGKKLSGLEALNRCQYTNEC